jgi:hypothetical protein
VYPYTPASSRGQSTETISGQELGIRTRITQTICMHAICGVLGSDRTLGTQILLSDKAELGAEFGSGRACPRNHAAITRVRIEIPKTVLKRQFIIILLSCE